MAPPQSGTLAARSREQRRRERRREHDRSDMQKLMDLMREAHRGMSLATQVVFVLALSATDALILHVLQSFVGGRTFTLLLASSASGVAVGLSAPFLFHWLGASAFRERKHGCVLAGVLNLVSCCTVLGVRQARSDSAGSSTAPVHVAIMWAAWHSLVVAMALPLLLRVAWLTYAKVSATSRGVILERLFPRVPRVRLVDDLEEAAVRDDSCVICLESVKTSDNLCLDGRLSSWCGSRSKIGLDGKGIIVLSCKHAFHAKCIEGWLSRGNDRCPTCREPAENARRHQRVLLRAGSAGELSQPNHTFEMDLDAVKPGAEMEADAECEAGSDVHV